MNILEWIYRIFGILFILALGVNTIGLFAVWSMNLVDTIKTLNFFALASFSYKSLMIGGCFLLGVSLVIWIYEEIVRMMNENENEP